VSRRVRVRGIYATALTATLLDAGHEVVDASPPIRRRFDAAFPRAPPDIRIETSADRQGVGAGGEPAAIDAVRGLLTDAGRDAFAWADPTPPGAVLDGEVTETLGGGTVVALNADPAGAPGSVEGYLPYGSVDARVETGDPVRVQVRESAAPWTDRRPELSGELRVGGDLVALEPGSGTRVDVRSDEAARELSGMVELLGLEPPDGWQAVWQPPAVDADTEALTAGLDDAVDDAERLHTAAAAGDGSEAGTRRPRRPVPAPRRAGRHAERGRLGLVRPREPVRTRRRAPRGDRDDAGPPPPEGGARRRVRRRRPRGGAL